jgi:hypothetical protein
MKMHKIKVAPKTLQARQIAYRRNFVQCSHLDLEAFEPLAMASFALRAMPGSNVHPARQIIAMRLKSYI